MWEIPAPGKAEFRANGWRLTVLASSSSPSPEPGIEQLALQVARDGDGTAVARLRLPGIALAGDGEQFVCGDELHLHFPESDRHPIGVQMVLMPIEIDQRILVVESVISVNTSLWDSHPAVEVEFAGGASTGPGSQPAQLHHGRNADGRVCWWLSDHPSSAVATGLLCDARDFNSIDPSATVEQSTVVRFLGGFLEKGVIRRIQPWWIWSQGPITETARRRVANQLAARPLPLSS